MVAERRSSFSYCLRDSERSLGKQSPKHPDGWGVAFFQSDAWRIHKSVACANEDDRFDRIVSETADVLVAHVRKKTIGDVHAANTHPFQRHGWVFAHNGTIEDCEHLRRHTSRARATEIEGDTDSERLFAYVLSAIDEEGPERGVKRAVTRMFEARVRGSYNFVLSDGATMFACRSGRPLFVLSRKDAGPRGVLVASDKFTAEDWRVVPERSLLRID